MHGNRTYSYRASKEKPSTSRKDKALPTQLGKANPRSLGTRGCTGLQGAFHPTALPKAASKASKTLRGRGESPAGRDPEHDNKKCYRRDHTQRARFPVHSLPGTKEGWRSETSHQSKNLNRFVHTEHFKMEGSAPGSSILLQAATNTAEGAGAVRTGLFSPINPLHLSAWNSKTIMTDKPSSVIESDASTRGWGASCEGHGLGTPGPQRRDSGISTAWKRWQPFMQ